MNAQILKELAKPIAPTVTIILKTSYETGHIPLKWKESSIGAVYKKADKHDPENYSPTPFYKNTIRTLRLRLPKIKNNGQAGCTNPKKIQG